MANLINTYNSMIRAQQAEIEKTAAAYDPKIEVLEKYASLADNLLANEFGNDYGKDDVVKLAGMMINHDIEQEQNMEKVAEYYQAGQIMAEGFKAAMNAR